MRKSIIVAALTLAALVASPSTAAAGDVAVDVGVRGRHGEARVQIGRRSHTPVRAPHARPVLARPVAVRTVPARTVPVRVVCSDAGPVKLKSTGRAVDHHHHGNHCRFVPGHYDLRPRNVWEPGHYETTIAPAVFETRWNRFSRCYQRVQVTPARPIRTWVPGQYVERKLRVWVRSHWVCEGHRLRVGHH